MVVTMKPSQPLDGVRDERGEQIGKRIHVGVHHVGAFSLQLLKFKKNVKKMPKNAKMEKKGSKYLNNVPLTRFGGVDQSGVTIIIDVINVSGL